MYDAGRTLLYLSWGCCVAALVMAVRIWGSVGHTNAAVGAGGAEDEDEGEGELQRSGWRRLIMGALPLSVAASLTLPMVQGTGVGGDYLVLSGWGGLDAASVVAVVGTSFVASLFGVRRRMGSGRGGDGAPSSSFESAFLVTSAAGVILGNVLILAGWPGEPRLHPGGVVVAGWSLAVACVCGFDGWGSG